jgi:hypothetical protein
MKFMNAVPPEVTARRICQSIARAKKKVRGVVGADYEGVNALEEREEQLPSCNRRGGPKGRDGSKVEMVLLYFNERMWRRVIPIRLPPRRCAPPLLFQEGSYASLSTNAFTPS